MDYKIFKKTILGKKGKKTKRWYYWWIDERGIQRQKVCKHCSNRAEAAAFVAALSPLRRDVHTVAEIARDMFLPDSEHVKRRAAFGKGVVASTLRERRVYVEDIIARWGCYDIRDINVKDITTYLLGDEHSASWKKHYISTIKEICAEAAWRGVNVACPVFPSFMAKAVSADILSGEELRRLFVRENFANPIMDSTKPYLLFLVSATAGLRIGEAQGLRASQFLFDRKALVIDGFLRRDGSRTTFNKAGSQDDRKIRVVLLPDGVLAEMREFLAKEGKSGGDFVFTHSGQTVPYQFLRKTFDDALARAGIDVAGRKLTPHSLRFTYVTKMRRTLPIDTVRKLVGHTDDKMTEYYTRGSLEDGLAAIAHTKRAVEGLFE